MIAPPRRPSHDELEALIKEARERQLRRRLLGAAGAAIAAASGLAVYALTVGGGSGRSPVGDPSAAGVVVCRTGQLSAFTALGGAAGSLIGPVEITNTGRTACALPAGRPAVRVTFHGGLAPTEERVWPPDSLGRVRPIHVLRPGAKAMVMLWWNNWCSRPGRPRPEGGPVTMLLGFSGGLQVAAPEQTPENAPEVPPCSDELHPSAPSTLDVSRPLRPS